MKKFSNITNAKIGQKKETKEVKMNEEESFRFALMGLIDKYLHIQTYGPIDRYLRAGTIKITGKEALVEALTDLMSDKSTLEKTILLESLKSKVGDWEAIDEKIDEIGTKWTSEKTSREFEPHQRKIEELFEKYGQDEEILVEMTNRSASRIKSHRTAVLRSKSANLLFERTSNDTFAKMSTIYTERANQLVGNE